MFYFCAGEMAERSNAAVLKTVDCHRSGGSNPSLSAVSKASTMCWLFLFCTSLNRRFKRVFKTKKPMPRSGMAFETEFPPKGSAKLIPPLNDKCPYTKHLSVLESLVSKAKKINSASLHIWSKSQSAVPLPFPQSGLYCQAPV